MEKSVKTVEPEEKTSPVTETTVFAASWDVFYQDAQGLECHLQLKGTNLQAIWDLALAASGASTSAGGKPSRRMAGNTRHGDEGSKNSGNGHENADNGAPREPTYTDERGIRRCNRKLTDGSVCGRPVKEREGRYGTFWSCPNYKAHAPTSPR